MQSIRFEVGGDYVYMLDNICSRLTNNLFRVYLCKKYSLLLK